MRRIQAAGTKDYRRKTRVVAEIYARRAHIDHIQPRSQGGGSDPSNLQVLCARCNTRKGSGRTRSSPIYDFWESTPEGLRRATRRTRHRRVRR